MTKLKHDLSSALFAKARTLMPGGVNSPVRAFKSVGGEPLFIARGKGPYVFDVDGNRFVDYVGSYGPLINGHAHPAVTEAIERAAKSGTCFGAPTTGEIALAEKVVALFPSIEMVRMVNSGTEAAISALRLARAATGRPLVVKFIGGYHGHGDAFLVKAGSGATTLGTPDSPGVPAEVTALTLNLPYNSIEALAEAFAVHGDRIACVMVEPVAGNMGLVPPGPGFLAGLRELCTKHGSLLVFDEVMTGFRVHPGGAQALYGVRPDVTVLGKVIGGGLPVGAYGGPRDLMERIAPAGPVYQAGTLSGNPVAMAAGLANLEELTRPGKFDAMARNTETLISGMQQILADAGIATTGFAIGGMCGLFFNPGPIADYDDVKKSDFNLFNRFFWGVLERGVYLPPSQWEAFFTSTVHNEGVVAETLEAVKDWTKTL
jgi:glutamate-1-semialdehyde 2,1-aminomutase